MIHHTQSSRLAGARIMADDAGDLKAVSLARLLKSYGKLDTDPELAELSKNEACLARHKTMPCLLKLAMPAHVHDLETPETDARHDSRLCRIVSHVRVKLAPCASVSPSAVM